MAAGKGFECRPTSVDLLLALIIIVGLLNTGFAVGLVTITDTVPFYKWYGATLLGVGALLCFSMALPSWRGNGISCNFMGAYGLILLGQALGFMLCDIYPSAIDEGGFTELHRYIKDIWLSLHAWNTVKAYLCICAFSICGISMYVLGYFCEFFAKYSFKLSCCYMLNYSLFQGVLAMCATFCIGLGIPNVFNVPWFYAELFFQPRVVSGVLRLVSGVTIAACLVRPFGKCCLSKLILGLAVVGQAAMIIICACNFQFPLLSDWRGYRKESIADSIVSHKSVTYLWIVTSCLTIICLVAVTCFYPTPKPQRAWQAAQTTPMQQPKFDDSPGLESHHRVRNDTVWL